MNNYIRDLAKQAEFSVKDLNTYDDNFQKFTELILVGVINSIYRSDISNRKQDSLVEEIAYKFGLSHKQPKPVPPPVIISQEEKDALSNWAPLE